MCCVCTYAGVCWRVGEAFLYECVCVCIHGCVCACMCGCVCGHVGGARLFTCDFSDLGVLAALMSFDKPNTDQSKAS